MKYVRIPLLSAAAGLLAGLSSSIFLYSLNWVTEFRIQHDSIIWFLPLAGLFIGWVYHHYGHDVAAGHNLILDEIHDPKKIVPLKMAPFILLGTLFTHLFGGSAGREGTAVQMGGSLADQLTHYFKLSDSERRTLLMAGLGAGFGSAIGAPLAGAVFGVEVLVSGRFQWRALTACLVSSYVAYYFAFFLHTPHSHFIKLEPVLYSPHYFLWMILAGVIFGLAARTFLLMTHAFEKYLAQLIRQSMYRPLVGGAILILLYYLIRQYDGGGGFTYAGLGIDVIQKTFESGASFVHPIFKSILTSITVGSGFKGGEFVPLVFIGTTLGALLSNYWPIAMPVLSAVGFSAVFAGAARVPLACAIMACEIFGYSILPYALIACYASVFCAGPVGLYKSQRR